MKLVTNHWGWSPRGIWTWIRFGWSISVWGVEDGSRRGVRRYRRRVKIGPICFPWGYFEKREGT